MRLSAQHLLSRGAAAESCRRIDCGWRSFQRRGVWCPGECELSSTTLAPTGESPAA